MGTMHSDDAVHTHSVDPANAVADAAPVGGPVVVVRGAEGVIGERILRSLRAQGVIAVADTASGATVVIDAVAADYDLLGAKGLSPVVEVAKTVDLANECGANHIVLISSAMVYGATPNNPVPLTEEAVLRPPPDFDYPRLLAAAEELVEQWRLEHPRPDDVSARLEGTAPHRSDGVPVEDHHISTVFRLAVPLSERHSSSLARALSAGLGQQRGRVDPPAQFVHLDDVVSAVQLGVQRRLDGVFNVAPDGWIAGDRLPALAGNPPRLRLPDRLAEVVSRLQWRFQRGPIPPGLRPYVQHAWVIANDKLRREGWTPELTNEEAFVEGTEAPWWSMVTPKRRQELALGAMVAAMVVLVVGVVGAIGRHRRA